MTALHYIQPVTFFNAHDEIIKLLWDCVVEQDPTGQQSQGPTDKSTLLPFSLRHMGNTQSGSGMLVCSTQKNFTYFLFLSGKKKTLFIYNRIHSQFYIHELLYRSYFKFKNLRVIYSLAVCNTFHVQSSTLRGDSLEVFFSFGGSFTFVTGKAAQLFDDTKYIFCHCGLA